MSVNSISMRGDTLGEEKNSVTLSKDMLYGIVIAVLAGLLILSIFTSGFGIVKPATTYVPPSGTQPTGNQSGTQPVNNTQPAQAVLPALTVSSGKLPALGQASAPVTLVVVSDYQCPYCSRLYTGAESSVKANYIQSGKVKMYFKDFPLSFHQFAMSAAIAARCANDQGKFWEMHDTLFQNQATWSAASDVGPLFTSYANALGMDNSTFTACFNGKQHTAEINADEAEAQGYGVQGTPGSFIIVPKSKITLKAITAAVDAQNAQYGAGALTLYEDSTSYTVLIPGAFPYEAFNGILSQVSY